MCRLMEDERPLRAPKLELLARDWRVLWKVDRTELKVCEPIEKSLRQRITADASIRSA